MTHTVYEKALTIREENRQSVKEMRDVCPASMPIANALFWQIKLEIATHRLHYFFALTFHNTLLN
jgi:hypothetical protein